MSAVCFAGMHQSSSVSGKALYWTALVAQHPSVPRLIQHETLEGGRRLTPMLQAWIQPVFERAQEMVETSSAATRWQPDQFPLLVLAMYHVFVGYFNIASLYQDMNGQDLLEEEALAKQARFYADLVETLFAEAGAGEGC